MSHKYPKGEHMLPSVTTIISDCTDKSGALCQWSANQAAESISNLAVSDIFPWISVHKDDTNASRFAYKETSDVAKDVGKEVHDAIEKYLRLYMEGVGVRLEWKTEQAKTAFEAFIKWTAEHDLRPIALEQKVYGNCWGGTLDYLGRFDDKLYVIDWKSSKAFYPEMRYQVAAYRSTWEQFDSSYIEGCGVLRLDKTTGLPSFHDTSKTYLKDLSVFNAMLQLYMLRHPIIARKSGWKG